MTERAPHWASQRAIEGVLVFLYQTCSFLLCLTCGFEVTIAARFLFQLTEQRDPVLD